MGIFNLRVYCKLIGLSVYNKVSAFATTNHHSFYKILYNVDRYNGIRIHMYTNYYKFSKFKYLGMGCAVRAINVCMH